jgi:hypothetical protein
MRSVTMQSRGKASCCYSLPSDTAALFLASHISVAPALAVC